MAQQIESASPADMVKDAREGLGEALHLVDAARGNLAAGVPADLGAVITQLERVEMKLEELAEEIG